MSIDCSFFPRQYETKKESGSWGLGKKWIENEPQGLYVLFDGGFGPIYPAVYHQP
jgi:hypothetical protein